MIKFYSLSLKSEQKNQQKNLNENKNLNVLEEGRKKMFFFVSLLSNKKSTFYEDEGIKDKKNEY